MKKGWEYKSLNDLCSIVGRIGFRGYTKEDLVSNPDDGAITLSPSNIVDGELVFSKCSYINWQKYEESPEIMLKSGDVVLVKTASIGKCAVVRNLPHKATLNPQFVVLKELKVNPEFITYYLKTPFTQSQIVKMAGGVAIPTLSQKKLGTLNIPVPPLSEQKEIVEYLDSSFAKIDKLKENAAKNLEEAKALFQSALKDALEPKEGWEEKTLGEVAKICGGKRLPKGCKLQSEPTNHKYIRVADFLDNGTVCKDEIQYITDDIFNQIKRYTISSDDVYISIAGTIGKSGIVPDELNGANLTENACKLVLNKEQDKRFIYFVTISPFFKEQINILTKKSAQPKLALTRLATVNVPIPPLSEQQSIVSFLDSLNEKVNTLQQNYSRICDECDALKQAILRQVFE